MDFDLGFVQSNNWYPYPGDRNFTIRFSQVRLAFRWIISSLLIAIAFTLQWIGITGDGKESERPLNWPIITPIR